MTENSYYYQITDININRITGSLRLLEDISRVCDFNLKESISEFKETRHKINSLFDYNKLLEGRNIQNDSGKFLNPEYEISKKNIQSIIQGNFRRINESLRVLEEMSKLLDCSEAVVKKIKEIRFKMYGLEKKSLLHKKKGDRND
ncbi:MAG: thiamine-phosphate pyrophosphorylase [Candidatus Muiribacteriota bacterium]